ncbi:kelch-like protein 33 [Aulostomus maculatus]
MECSGSCLPKEWEEQWRREKEKRKRVIEEGREGIEQDNCELRRIVAYNDSRMGLTRGRVKKEFRVRGGRRSEDGSRDYTTEEAREDEGPPDNVRTYHSKTYPTELFLALKKFRDLRILTDLTLTTDSGDSFNVHSPVLAAVSVFIRERLTEEREALLHYNDVHKWSLSLGPDVDHVGLQALLEFAYTRVALSLNKSTLVQIKAAAHALGVPRLLGHCKHEEWPKEDERTSAVEQTITLQSMEELRENRVGCDVALEVDGDVYHVHRVILAGSSDFFRGMFTSGMRESHQASVGLPFLLASELEALINFSYSGNLPLSWDCVFEICCIALQLQFQPAILLCLEFMQQEMESRSCLDVVSFAEAYGMSELLDEANDFVLRNFWEVSSTAKFLDLQAEKLLGFLCSDGLCVPSELAVFRAVMSWVEADPGERLKQAGLLMKGVRFPLMTFREFREVRAINLRLECRNEVELYGSAFKQFGLSLPPNQDQCRIRRPKYALVLVGGDQLNPDVGQRIPSRELWFVNSLRSGTGLVKEIEWRRLGMIPDKPKFRHGIATMGGRLYVVGGCYFYTKHDMMKSTYSYDPVQDSWKKLADMQEFRSNFSLVVHEEHLYAIGGDKEINTNVDSVERYNTDTDSWSFVRPLDQPLSGYAVTVLNGGIFISGGFNCKYTCLISMFLYQPETGTTYLADMNHDRAQHCMEALQGHLYVAGGVCNLRKFYTDQQTCEVYDPVADTWTAFTSLPVSHVGAASAILEEKIYILGGYCQEDYSESGLVHRYNPSIQRWENMGKLPAASTDVRACLLQLPQHFRQ